MPGHHGVHGELDPGDALPGLERHVGAGVDAWSAVLPPLARPRDSAIEKQVEWAAAISSSGLVLPFACSAREAPADFEAADTGRDELDLALALEQRAFPVGFRGPNCCHRCTPHGSVVAVRRTHPASRSTSRRTAPGETMERDVQSSSPADLLRRRRRPRDVRGPGEAVLRRRRLRPAAARAVPRGGSRTAETRFRMFLEQYWGGPTTYSEQRGHPRLRMRHAPFAVTPQMRDRWLTHMRDAIDSLDWPRSITRSSGPTWSGPRTRWSTPSTSTPGVTPGLQL